MHTVVTNQPTKSQSRSLAALLKSGGRDNNLVVNGLFVASAGLIVVSAFIHLHLWNSGYRRIPTVGPLFMAQVVSGFAIAALVLLTRNFRAVVVAFGFVASTLGGFLLSVNIGLFGFKDSFSAPDARIAFIFEIAALVSLIAAGASSLRSTRRSEPTP
jgi:hypothetical protein